MIAKLTGLKDEEIDNLRKLKIIRCVIVCTS